MFVPYDGKQTEFILFLESLLQNPKDVFISKPRDVGATSLALNFFLKHWLFDDTFNVRIGSRKEEYVDRTGDPDTLFFKIDYTLNRLPLWMLPEEWDKRDHRSHMRLSRPDNENAIVGESANPNFARGGRQKIVFFDEIGFWPFARSAWESAGDVTDVRLAMTTPPPVGKSSFAYKLRSGQAGAVHVLEFDYSDVPSKDTQWIKDQKKRRSDEEFEREVMKSYSGTTKGKVYASDWQLYVKESEIGYDPSLPLFIAWDFGLDEVAMIWLQKEMKANRVRIIDSYNNSQKQIDFYVPLVSGTIISGAHKYDLEALEKIKLHRDWKQDITHFGDPDVIKRNLIDKQSAFSSLRKRGIYINSKPWGGRKHRDIREKTKLLLRRLEVNYERCQDFIEAVVSAQYPQKAETAQPTTEQDKPSHDWSSHYRSALEYFADNEPFYRKGPDDEKIHKNEKKFIYRPMGGYS